MQDRLRRATGWAVQQGHDPRIAKRQDIQEAEARAAIPTFQEVAETVIELRRPTWTSDRHVTQWTESLTKHAFPVIWHKRIDTVTTADVLAVLTPIWIEHPETSTRVKQRLGKVLDNASAHGWRCLECRPTPEGPGQGTPSRPILC